MEISHVCIRAYILTLIAVDLIGERALRCFTILVQTKQLASRPECCAKRCSDKTATAKVISGAKGSISYVKTTEWYLS